LTNDKINAFAFNLGMLLGYLQTEEVQNFLKAKSLAPEDLAQIEVALRNLAGSVFYKDKNGQD